MKLNRKNKKIEIILIASFILAILIFTAIPYLRSLNVIRDSVLRLHVLANSDSDYDQNIKLAVRDKILEFGGDVFNNSNTSVSKVNAKNEISYNLATIKQLAQQVVNSYGENYFVDVSIENKYFNTRQYEDVTLPAGLYDSLVIRIGEANGQNWWCVMFPPMCLPAATETQELSQVLDDNQIHILTDDTNYTIKFAVVEAIEEFSHNSY